MPRVESPNWSPRPAGVRPRLIVLHATGPGTLKGVLEWMSIKASRVSYHGLIAADGAYYQIVDPKHTAWHAGVSEWNGVKNVNQISLGLSFVNPNDGQIPLTPQQISVAKGVIQYWRQQYDIEDIVTHAAVARPRGRKTDPEQVPNFRLSEFDWRV
ncbi:MAG: N-acetylmuramoyl-L-alanine amidase [Candidatus Limnocylindrus sp.]